MLRGLDMRGGAGDPGPMVKVAGRDPVEGRVTAYVDASASDADDRRRALRSAFEKLERSGVVADTRIVTWQEADTMVRYEEFIEAVGAAALEPHFASLAGGEALDVPAVCLEVRDPDGDLTGLYPQDGASVEDGLRALRTGDGIENVGGDGPDVDVEALDADDAEPTDEETDPDPGRVAKAD